MDATYRIKAIVLRRADFGEYNTKVCVYSREKGMQELIARGTKKLKSKLAGHLEPFCLSEIMVISGKQYNYIGAAVSQNCFLNIKNDLDKILAVGSVFNVTRSMLREELDDENVYILLNEYLKLINSKFKNEIDYEYINSIYILKLLSALGHRPQVHKCTECGSKLKSGKNYFSLENGGVVCLECSQNWKSSSNNKFLTISEPCVKVLRLIIDMSLSDVLKVKITKQNIKEIKNITSTFLKYQKS